jgi:hypothetical protein
MTIQTRSTYERLKSITTADRMSVDRAEIMRRFAFVDEHLRRSALWAHATGLSRFWPLWQDGHLVDAFGVAFDRDFWDAKVSEAVAENGMALSMLEKRLFREAFSFETVPQDARDAYGLPDPFEPLLWLKQQGGRVDWHQGLVVDLATRPRIGTLASYLDHEPFAVAPEAETGF